MSSKSRSRIKVGDFITLTKSAKILASTGIPNTSIACMAGKTFRVCADCFGAGAELFCCENSDGKNGPWWVNKKCVVKIAPPKVTKGSKPVGIEAEVCKDIADRQALGIKKYGGTVADNKGNLRYWLNHAYQEALDQAIYLKRAMAELPE